MSIWFILIGLICMFFGVGIMSCCVISGRCSEIEEIEENKRKSNQK